MPRDDMLTKLYDERFLLFAYQQCLQKHKIQMKKCRKINCGVPTYKNAHISIAINLSHLNLVQKESKSK